MEVFQIKITNDGKLLEQSGGRTSLVNDAKEI